ncbi:zinc-dependent alcohol dehydrogenase [Aquipuribacter sp. SD81]|uniref:zinc-dependent alcohol dehydrogenase n=1 Tax=Aquipuribacter sp. SD81 TaxID=3127703 RepID=UPI00301A1C46
MLALELFRSVPRYAAARAVSAVGSVPGLLIGPMAPVRLVTTSEPEVRHDGWAQVKVHLSGICGSDLGAVTGSTSLYFAAVSSMPCVPGHELVGTLTEDCEDLPAGTRVVVDPVLACAARGLEPCEQCAAGHTNRCDRVTVGHLKPGLQTGYCRSTGGGWGERLVAHRSQLHAVPDDLPDERAVLVEPLACAVRLAERAAVREGQTVLVSGAGAVGLFATLALRELTPAGRIVVVAKHGAQAALARRLGATDVVEPGEALRGVRRLTQALTVRTSLPGLAARQDQEFLLGGVDVAVDAVGSAASLDLALRATRAGGRVVVSGMPGRGADLSPAWFRELEVVGTYASAGDAFPTALRLAATAPLGDGVGGEGDVLGAVYPLHRWREALDHASSAGRLGTVKVAFDPRQR